MKVLTSTHKSAYKYTYKCMQVHKWHLPHSMCPSLRPPAFSRTRTRWQPKKNRWHDLPLFESDPETGLIFRFLCVVKGVVKGVFPS